MCPWPTIVTSHKITEKCYVVACLLYKNSVILAILVSPAKLALAMELYGLGNYPNEYSVWMMVIQYVNCKQKISYCPKVDYVLFNEL